MSKCSTSGWFFESVSLNATTPAGFVIFNKNGTVWDNYNCAAFSNYDLTYDGQAVVIQTSGDCGGTINTTFGNFSLFKI